MESPGDEVIVEEFIYGILNGVLDDGVAVYAIGSVRILIGSSICIGSSIICLGTEGQ